MRKALRENWVLIIGVLLPILLVVTVGLITQIPRLTVKPPTYDLLYMTSSYPNPDLTVEIDDKGKLTLWANPQSKQRHSPLPLPKLFRYNVKTQTSTEIPFTMPPTAPQDLKTNQIVRREEISVPELQNLTLDTRVQAPDGYEINFSNSSPANIANFFFMGNSSKNELVISKHFNDIKITGNKETGSNYNIIRFLGWIIPNKD